MDSYDDTGGAGSANGADGRGPTDGGGRRLPTAGIAALTLPYRIAAALALAVFAVLAVVHLAMVFLYVSPANTITKRHGEAVDKWIYPEFEQNWKLFAPNPLQSNIAVQVRAEVRVSGGESRITGWRDLTAEDGAAIRGNPMPSHTQQNELRRAWDFYTGSHDTENKPNGLRGSLSENYIRRIVMLRLGPEEGGGSVERIQLRSRAVAVAPPAFSAEKISTKPVYRVLPWWSITEDDLQRSDRQESDRRSNDEKTAGVKTEAGGK